MNIANPGVNAVIGVSLWCSSACYLCRKRPYFCIVLPQGDFSEVKRPVDMFTSGLD
jgi:hypothetical protein